MISSERDEIESLWSEAQEFDRRTFSNVAVTLASGVKVLEVSPITGTTRYRIAVRDNNGHVVLGNDTVAQWGLTAPLTGIPSYSRDPIITHGAGATFATRWRFYGFIYGPTIEWAYTHGTEFPDTFAETRFTYQWISGGAVTPIPGSTAQSNQDVSNTSTVFTVVSGTFTFPDASTRMGQACAIELQQRTIPGGSGSQSFATPRYLNQVT